MTPSEKMSQGDKPEHNIQKVKEESQGDKQCSGAEQGSEWDEDIQDNWTYIGHGEWIQMSPGGTQETIDHIPQETDLAKEWWATVDGDIGLHERVIQNGNPNRWGARIPVKSGWNLVLMEELLRNYEDKEVVEWIRYGWPTGRLPTLPAPAQTGKTTKGA